MEIPQTHKSQQSQAYTLLGKVVEAAASHPQGKQIREEDARHIHLEPEAVAALYQKALVKDPQNEYAQDRYKALVGKDFVKKLKEPIAKYAPARHLPISPRLSKDAHARLDEGREVQWYWDKQSGKHKALIESLDRQIGEGMSPNTRIAVCIPTYMEEKNIYRTLEQYTKQENIDPKQVEIILLENHPAGKQRDNTRAEVVRFRHDYPDMTVRRVYHQFDQMVPFGYIKKIVFDLGLRRSMKRPADPKRPDLIMAGHDADSYGYKKNSFRYLLDIFDTNQDMDLLAGRADAPVEAMAKFPVLHAIVRFERYYKTISDRYNGKMRTSASGGCTYFRLSSYAAMGGYDDTLWRGSDSEHGKRMWYLRGEDPRRHMSYTDGLRFHTDPRRALEKMINGKHYADQWEDIQWQGVRQVIGTSWEDFSHPDLMTFDKARLEEEINAYKFVQKLAVNLQADPANSEVQKKKMILDRIMNSLGASYHMDGNRLVLDNTADLESGLQIYAEKFANQTA